MATLTELKSILRATPNRLATLVQNVPGDLLNRIPAPDEWSAAMVLKHLVDADRDVFPARIKALLAGEEFGPLIAGTGDFSVAPLDLVAQFEALRAENLILLEQVTPEHFDRMATHPRMGRVSMLNVLNYWGGHDLMHLVQMEQALMQVFIADSGPWHVNFAKHVANSEGI
jgi:hypothetical protein